MSTRPASRSLATVRRAILAWYGAEHRDFPWRGVTDPYAVLVSEVMLQQTQATRIAGRYASFLGRFPSPAALAAAPAADVLAEWSGLGYNRRALALRRAAGSVVADGWPTTVAGLERLPGVGPYTARAVASLAFGVPVGVVDTNVRRWLLRRFRGPDAPAPLQRLADRLAAGGQGPAVAAWTHASMEFGAAICRARRPRCEACPVASGCPSRGRSMMIPVPRQPALRGSDRAIRGAILRRLSVADAHRLDAESLRASIGDDPAVGAPIDGRRWDDIVAALQRDGLVHRRGTSVALGEARIGA